MEEVGKALKSIFDKLSDFFDIFDLSFFVSGVALTGSILFWLNEREMYTFQEIQFKGIIIVYILICYIAGMIAFATGRWIRIVVWENLKSLFKKKNRFELFDEYFKEVIKAHELNNNPTIKEYLNKQELRSWRLYIRLWAVIRENKKYANSLSIIKRYWVMAATYDGLSFFSLIATLITADLGFGILGDKTITNCCVVFPIIAFTLSAFLICIREADRYLKNQVEEVIATIAAGEKECISNCRMCL